MGIAWLLLERVAKRGDRIIGRRGENRDRALGHLYVTKTRGRRKNKAKSAKPKIVIAENNCLRQSLIKVVLLKVILKFSSPGRLIIRNQSRRIARAAFGVQAVLYCRKPPKNVEKSFIRRAANVAHQSIRSKSSVGRHNRPRSTLYSKNANRRVL